MHKLEELKEMLCEELEEYASKEKLDMGGLEIVDKLAHAIKNIDKILNSDGYSEGRLHYGYNDASYRNYSSRGRKRDSMGRYARDNMYDELSRLAEDAPDEMTRRKLERLMQSM